MEKIKQEDVALRDKINTATSTVQLQDYLKINTPHPHSYSIEN